MRVVCNGCKEIPLSQTTTTKKRMRKSRTLWPSAMVDIDEGGSDCEVFYNAGANPAGIEIPGYCSTPSPPPPGKQSYPTANLKSSILWSGQQTGQGTNKKKVSGHSTWTAVNHNGKSGLEAMTEAGGPNPPADPAEPPRKIVCSLSTRGPGPHNRPLPLTSDPSDNEVTVASQQIQIEASAQPLLTLASRIEQPPSRSAILVRMPCSSYYPCDPCCGDVLDIPVAEAE